MKRHQKISGAVTSNPPSASFPDISLLAKQPVSFTRMGQIGENAAAIPA
jgi:hypothetical protein